jgi:ribonucleotide reductase beta subunit family protein with ferritin-like domain
MIQLQHKPKYYNKLFFGDSDIARLDISGDKDFKALAELSEKNTWFLNVVNCKQDRWHEMSPIALRMYRLNLGYQTAMDSLVPDLFAILQDKANDPWLSYLYSRIHVEEKIHAGSYSLGISQAFGAEAEEFLDIIYTDPYIANRIDSELTLAHQLVTAVEDWNESQAFILLQALGATFFLEGIKFPFSFFTSFTINKAEENKAQGFTQVLILIANDEMSTHTTTGSTLLRKLSRMKPFKQYFDNGSFQKWMRDYFATSIQAEKQWATYLLQDGDLPGFNQAICDHFLEYWCDKRLKELHLEPLFNFPQKNDIEKWFDEYRNINGKNSALQEISNISYTLAQTIDDLAKFDKEIQ